MCFDLSPGGWLSCQWASLRWPVVTLPAGPHGWISVSGDESELTGLANQAPGAIPDFAVLLQETGGDEPGREAAA